MRLRLATFNILHGRATEGPVDVPLLRTSTAALGADVLGLQEVDVGAVRSGRHHLAEEVAEACGFDAVFGAVLAVSHCGSVAIDAMQRCIADSIDDLQPALRGGFHQVTRDLGLAIDHHGLAGEIGDVDPDQPLAIGQIEAFLDQPFGAQPVAQGGDPGPLLPAHRPALAGMGVEAGHRDARSGDAEIADQPGMGDADRAFQQRRGQRLRNLVQRDVDRCRHHAAGRLGRGRGQHHRYLGPACEMSEVFGMARKGKARALFQRLLADRQGDDAARSALHGKARGAGDHVDDALRIGPVGPAGDSKGGKIVAQHREPAGRDRLVRPGDLCPVRARRQVAGIAHPDHRHARRQCLGGQFRADARRLAAGEDQRRQGAPAHGLRITASARSSAR